MDRLPEELIDTIATFADQEALYNWLRTSQRYLRVIEPHIYRQLVIRDTHINFPDTMTRIIEAPGAFANYAEHVTKIDVDDEFIIYSNYPQPLQPLQYLIISSRQLQYLRIQGINWKHFFSMIGRLDLTRRQRGLARDIQLPQVPMEQKYLRLKTVWLGDFYLPLSNLTHVLELPALETLVVKAGYIVTEDIPKMNNRWNGTVSRVRNLHLVDLEHFRRLPFVMGQTRDSVAVALLRLLLCCPRLETLSIGLSIDSAQMAQQPRYWLSERELIGGLSALPLRKFILQRTNINQGPQESIANELCKGTYEELHLAVSLIMDVFKEQTATLPKTLKVLRLTSDGDQRDVQVIPDLLKKTPVAKVKTSLPLLERIVLHDFSWDFALDGINALIQLSVSYSTVGVSIVVDELIRPADYVRWLA